ncbi:DUF3152 domain-containing protein [Streptomyces sp. NPDC050485]|uniref:DUF3152 domain-containing protein n=1 Tax=Streptomyces sp. NPDC050485 TaxID=3365617 RepID=UPI0037A05C57
MRRRSTGLQQLGAAAVSAVLLAWAAWGPWHQAEESVRNGPPALQAPPAAPQPSAAPASSPPPAPQESAAPASSPPAAPQESAAPASSPPDDGLALRFPADPQLALRAALTTVDGHEVPERKDGAGRTLRYRVDVENGLAELGFAPALFASFVQQTLNDPRGWAHEGVLSFERIPSGDADFVVTLASPGTVNEWCAKAGLDTAEQMVSCDAYGTERVMINAYRWAQGAPTYRDDMLAYRQMLVNHEVGHRIGHAHETCDRDGAPAPVMMQQTKTLTTGTATCLPNPWPYP